MIELYFIVTYGLLNNYFKYLKNTFPSHTQYAMRAHVRISNTYLLLSTEHILKGRITRSGG